MIGRITKFLRVSKGLTQEELSKMLNIGRSTLSDYEREKTDINFETLEKLAEICDFEIVFKNKNTKEEITSKNVNRKDIKYEQTKKV